MKFKILYLVFTLLLKGFIMNSCIAQGIPFMNATMLKQLNSDSDYKAKREAVLKEFNIANTGAWGEFVKGVGVRIDTKEKIIALTFDACGGKNSSGYSVCFRQMD